MFRLCAGLGRAVLLLVLLFRWSLGAAEVPIRDGGINPASLGKGDWIWYVSQATNKLGGVAPSVVNLPTLMSYYKSQGLQYIIVKAGTGSTNFNGSGSSPQFNSNLVYHAHAAGLLIFAYTRSYDDDVPGEIAMAASCFALGADGWVIDAEAEWESGASQAGTNGPTRALQYGQGLRALFPTKFIAHAPFPIISFHSSFPYKEFGSFCDVVMPQAYWTEIYDEVDPVQRMFTAMDNEYRNWQNSLTGIWTNAIKPIAPIAQAWSSTSGVTTGTEIDEFFDRCRTNPNPASVTGYSGMSYWRADTKDAGMWDAIRTNVLGDVPGLPHLTMQPQSRTAVIGTNVTFTAWGTGSKPFYYRWRFNGTNLLGATAVSPNLVLTNVQLAHSGAYSVVVSNVSGVTTSLVATLNVTTPPTLFDVAVVPGGRSAIITWRSTNAADSQVEFGLTTAYGQASARDFRLTTNHSVLLGGLTPGASYCFGVVSRADGVTYRADGGMFSTAGELVMDNATATFSGTWLSGTASADKFGADYRYITTVAGGSTATAVYAPNIVVPGKYDVQVWYPQGGNRSTNAPVAIFYSGGATNVRINQETGGGAWREVGVNVRFRTGTGGLVRIGNGTGESEQVVMADAVRFVYRADQDAPNGAVVPDWWANHYFGVQVDPQLDHDGDGYPAWMEYVAGTAPTDVLSAVRLALVRENATMLRAEFAPCLPGRRYRLERKVGEAAWEPMGSPPVAVDAEGRGSILVPMPPEPMQWIRLRIEWDL